MKIEAVTESGPVVLEAASHLVSQLSTTSTLPTAARISRIMDSPVATLLMARLEDGTYAGMLTLIVIEIPTGVKALIEDVVVDADHRGKGLAKALTEEALRRAREAGARKVDLTSRPTREAANALYQKLGFKRRDSNVFRFSFE